ncbi:MAG: CehA/McbA family metallohydrolase [Chloroflexota bacterium]|nr:CehA/McbA family metallohydrolase [Chloroflexota bacterium]
MTSSLPFDRPGRFWKTNLHSHTTRSDGKLTPAELTTIYREQGYHALAITDHYLERYGFPIVDTTQYRTDNFTTLLGAELHGPGLMFGDWHILAVGLPADFAHATPGETGPEIAKRASDAGAFVAIAHPAWYSLMWEKAKEIDFADAVEVWNTTCHYDNDRAESWYLADHFLMTGHRPFAIATDDAHCSIRPDTFGGWTMVKAESLEPDALLAALKAGHFYASTGPDLHNVAIEGDKIVVETSPARVIYATGAGAIHRDVMGGGITRAEFDIEPFVSSYARITVLGQDGGKAWSNAIFFDDQK